MRRCGSNSQCYYVVSRVLFYSLLESVQIAYDLISNDQMAKLLLVVDDHKMENQNDQMTKLDDHKMENQNAQIIKPFTT